MPLMGFQTTDHVDYNEIYYGVVLPSIDIYREEELDLRQLLTKDHDQTIVKVRVKDDNVMQKLGEAEIPDARRTRFSKFRFDPIKYGFAIGFTEDYLADATSRDITDTQGDAFDADRDAIRKVILGAALKDPGAVAGGWYNANFTADEIITTPPNYGANTFLAAHNHYYASGIASIALTTITAAKKHVKEHGYKGRLVMWINSNETQAIEDLAGWNNNTNNNVANPITDRVAVDGFVGRFIGVDVVENDWIPAGYILMIDVGSTQSQKVMRFIQKNNESFRGLIIRRGADPDYPIRNSFFLRWFDAKVVIRGAGVAIQIVTGSTYTNPTTYNII